MHCVLLILLAWLGLALPAAGAVQGGATVTAGLSPGVIQLGERTSIVLSIERTDGGRSERTPLGALPAVDGLEIGPLTGPQTSSYQHRDGRRVRTSVIERWIIPVRPLREGEFEIPGLAVTVDGAVQTTQPLRLKVVVDMEGAELGFIEVVPSAARVIEGQPFSVEVRFGWDKGLAAINFAELTLGFLDGLPGAVAVESAFPGPGAQEVKGVTANGTEVVVEELDAVELRGRSFRQLRLLRSFLPTRGGRIELPESFLNFGEAEQRGGFLQTRLVKVKDYNVGAPRAYVEVVPLPEEGQPVDYTGAVGALSARAAVDHRDVDAGESIKLTVEWTGAGNLEFFEAPDLARLDSFKGFRVYGRTEEKSFEKRTAIYDLAPIEATVDAIPAIPLRVYDPEREAYTTVETPPIPIRVRALAGAVDLLGEPQEGAAEAGRDLRDIDATPLSGAAGREARAPARGLVLAALLGAPLCGLCLRALVRRRGDPAAPLERRRRRARRKLAQALAVAEGPEDELRALAAFLAERTREPDEAWIGRDVEEALRARSNGSAVPPEDAQRLRDLLARLERAVWSREGERVPPSELLDVADRLLGRGF
jgi:hypothetical protein